MAQVCYVNNVPFCVIRSISDTADGDPEMAYVDFLEIAAKNSILLYAFLIKLNTFTDIELKSGVVMSSILNFPYFNLFWKLIFIILEKATVDRFGWGGSQEVLKWWYERITTRSKSNENHIFAGKYNHKWTI